MSIIGGKAWNDQSKDSDTCLIPNIDEKIKEKEMIKEQNKEVKSLKQFIENLEV